MCIKGNWTCSESSVMNVWVEKLFFLSRTCWPRNCSGALCYCWGTTRKDSIQIDIFLIEVPLTIWGKLLCPFKSEVLRGLLIPSLPPTCTPRNDSLWSNIVFEKEVHVSSHSKIERLHARSLSALTHEVILIQATSSRQSPWKESIQI